MKFTFFHTVLLLVLIGLPCSQQAQEISSIELPEMGDSSGTLMTPDEENEFGEAFFRSLNAQITINQDAEIQQYIQTLGEKLVVSSDAPAHPFHFFVVLENDINAFAGPGGYIGVNSGLFIMTEAESELASVLAHEIAHVTQRHLFRAAEAAQRLTIPTMAATLAAILLGSQSPAMGQAAIMAIQAGSVQFQINFTRENEEEADRVGMQALAHAQFDPRSMPTFFERLQQSTRYYGQNIPEFLRTHPVTASRISDTRGRADTYPYKQYPDSLYYQLTKAKIRALTAQDLPEIARYFQAKSAQGITEQRVVARYGLGLILLKMQKYKEAEVIFLALHEAYPNQVQYASALAKVAVEAKDVKTALQRYQQLSEYYPDNQAIKMELISTLVKAEKPEQAKALMLTLNARVKTSPLYWQMLAQIYSKLMQPIESHRYLAEYYYAMGHTQEAILHIKLAQKAKGMNQFLAAILNERLNFFLIKVHDGQLRH